MIRFGVICPELSGHLNPMMALARALQNRGHQVTFYQRSISRTKIETAGFPVRVFGEKEFPVEKIRSDLATLATLSGIKALQFTIARCRIGSRRCFRALPPPARGLMHSW